MNYRMDQQMVDLGQVAYESYYVSCEGKSIRGEQLPSWAADGVKMWLESRQHPLNPDVESPRSSGLTYAPGPKWLSAVRSRPIGVPRGVSMSVSETREP